MFAVIKTGGKQYRVATQDVITVEKIKGEPGDIVEFGEVLMLSGESVVLGSPTIAGATVAGEVVEQTRGDKVIAFKKRRRKNSRRKRGHRQHLSVIRITEILTDGQRPTQAAEPEAEPGAVAPEQGVPAAEAVAPEPAAAPEEARAKAEAPKAKAAKKPAEAPAAKKPAKQATAPATKKGKKK